ncbi:NinI-like serine-threonine phosphatase [Caulobacter phage CcrBL10]|uniref:Serine/threonine protein phosphatase n=1 Tax=Caulobacter phage CcrBL10 TaxID=2283269 RepID=A0A385E9I3_9CAUD|nr:NinI-like serine-threonine phosphatase [Caulobacter phage CcrBL10]AXQ68463.1 serine/threonine protein phosphatase [Caulobacter phage CcrBL10]
MLYVFGDIHGRMDLLEEARHVIRVRGDCSQMIFLGDYVDRGPQSREVVEAVMGLHQQGEIALKGNHEQMMVDSWRIASYGALSKLWVSNGGKQTLKSYGAGDNAWNAQWDMIPQAHVDWMDALPTFYDTPGRVFVHAGLIPGVPLKAHDEEEMMWIRDRFLHGRPQDFEKHVVHGHTHTHALKKISEPELLVHRTNLDTGAFYTGILSVGVFDPDGDGGPVEVLKITEA